MKVFDDSIIVFTEASQTNLVACNQCSKPIQCGRVIMKLSEICIGCYHGYSTERLQLYDNYYLVTITYRKPCSSCQSFTRCNLERVLADSKQCSRCYNLFYSLEINHMQCPLCFTFQNFACDHPVTLFANKCIYCRSLKKPYWELREFLTMLVYLFLIPILGLYYSYAFTMKKTKNLIITPFILLYYYITWTLKEVCTSLYYLLRAMLCLTVNYKWK